MSASRNTVAGNAFWIYTELARVTTHPNESCAGIFDGVNRSEALVDGERSYTARAQAVIDRYRHHTARRKFLCAVENPGSVSQIPCAAVE